jgi:catechol 2,3-dioxygenase-like lactoylglutathione lyase family enzyme
MKLSHLVLVPLLIALPLRAQLATPNAAGVALGQIHLIVKDVAAERRFFIEMMGGTPVDNEKISMIQFPGVFLTFTQGDPAVSSPGSVLNHFGVVLKDVPAHIAKWEANHVIIDHAENPTSGYVHAPSGLRIEFYQDPSLSVPIAMHHLHFLIPQEVVPEVQAWYGKTFGGQPSQRYCTSCLPIHRRLMETVNLPGTNLSLGLTSQANSTSVSVPTKGRLIDHIGFEVKNLKAFVEKAEANGVKFDESYRVSRGSAKVHVAYLTDPWGTRIELTEGLAP